MKRIITSAAAVLGLCVLPLGANATLVGDAVSLDHYAPGPSYMCGTFPSPTTVVTGATDLAVVYCSYPWGYNVNVEADSILIDYTHLHDVSGTWWDTTLVCEPVFPFTCAPAPLSFNGLRVSDLDDSSGNPLTSVSVATNMAGWNTSMLSFDADEIWFDWKGLSFDGSTYFNATLVFGSGPTSVPEPASTLLFVGGIAGLAALRKRKPGVSK
ncbi:MAG: PEP-CTERM sorting domain-containing protein [Gammaproteobacteria bacterium]|nr:MAG: PEP-CTERM sorting domain-containing protein [Gammaproteobacteria bacterium]